MPRLSELTDYYGSDPMGNATGLPVEEPFPSLKKVYITGAEEPKVAEEPSPLSNNVDKILNALFRDDEKRLQLWPEKLLRSGTTAAGNVMSGEIPQWAVDPKTGDVHTSPQMVEAAQEMSALAGTGGLGGAGGTLNATPSLRPALKHNGKLYKGKPGQEHMDVIPESMYPDFQKKAMSGDDIKEYNFGFVNDKGHFLNREDALKYGIDNGLIDPQAGKYGALTSTLFADSSKPGTAIEAMGKSTPMKLINNKNGQYDIKTPDGQAMGTVSLAGDGTKPFVSAIDLGKDFKRQGVATRVYNNIEKEIGRKLIPSPLGLTTEATAFWKNRLSKLEPAERNALIDEAKVIGKDYGIKDEHLSKRLDSLYADTPALPPGYELKPIDYNPFELKS